MGASWGKSMMRENDQHKGEEGQRKSTQTQAFAPGRSASCSAGVKAWVRIKSVLTREVSPDAAKIIANTTN